MATVTDNSVELPAALLEDAKRYAIEEGRPVAALIEEAVRQYLEIDPKLHAMSREFREKARELGLTPDEYAVRMVKEVRAERRASAE
jgi:hypothetical protein